MKMNAIELNAVARDGRVTVIIPDAYRQAWDDKSVRVIVIVDEDAAPPKPKASLLARLQEIKISGPADFAENIDSYLNGEKNA
jgi:hypothetical protein